MLEVIATASTVIIAPHGSCYCLSEHARVSTTSVVAAIDKGSGLMGQLCIGLDSHYPHLIDLFEGSTRV
jgi:hypothetical protein